MPNLDLPLLVVDDARFSSTVVGRALRKAGYRDIRIVNNAPEALKEMEARPVSVLIADWLMPEMDGLELTDRVRQQDEQTHHYTYIILLTAKESVEALSRAFDRGVDDFIYKSDMSKQLLPRVYAADRLADRQNTLLSTNELLLESNRQLEKTNILDPQSGLGNHNYAQRRLQQALDYTESRGGATAYVLIGIRDWKKMAKRNGEATLEELVQGISRRLTNLIRPLDALCRVGENEYAIVAHFLHEEHCTPAAFRRLHDGLNHKAFKTSAGYISVEAATAVCIAGEGEPVPTIDAVTEAANEGLRTAYDTRTITRTRAEAPQARAAE